MFISSSGKSKEGTGANAGLLNLAIAEKGDVAYTEDVKADTNNYLDFTEGQTFTMTIAKGISSEGRRLTYFETEYKITDAIMEGYYEDTFLSAYGYVMDVQAALAVAFPVRGNVVILPSTEISPIKEDQLYKVTVYIRYSTIKPEEK